jgi:tetratricopeptide (TPR) repeat protein
MIHNIRFGFFFIILVSVISACRNESKTNQPDQQQQVQEQQMLDESTYAVTIDGKRLMEIPEPDSVSAKNKKDINEARMYYLGHLTEVKPYLNYGRECLKAGLVENAIQILSKGIDQFPNTSDLYLYRGMAYVMGRQFGAAINDFWKSGKAVEGQKDVKGLLEKSEEDKKIDATLHYDIYKWMGLAFQSQGDFSNAEKMFEVCADFSTNSDLYCMTYYWQYQSYMRAGRKKDGAQILESVDPKMFITVTKPYLDALLYYKGNLKESELINFTELPKSSVEARAWTIKAYAVAVKAYLENNQAKYKETLEKIVAIPYWNQPAYIAAEADLHAIKGFDYQQMESKELNLNSKKK